MRLANKVAIITGAASGMGRASALLFAKEGAKVIAVDINNEGGKETVDQIKRDGGEAIFVHVDVSKAKEVEQLIKTSVDTYGKLDILFNNAGHPGKSAIIENIDEAIWDEVYAVNVKAIFFGAKYAAPEMKKRGGGVILNTASIAGERPRPNQALYCSSKGAAIVLTKGLALELAPYKIRVNCIDPVGTDTPMIPKFLPEGTNLKEFLPKIIATIPMGRLAKPEDIAYAALYLASDEASMVTGVALQVDGGRGI